MIVQAISSIKNFLKFFSRQNYRINSCEQLNIGNCEWIKNTHQVDGF